MKLKGPTQCARRRRGFTIPEVIVATTILVIGFVGLYGAMSFGWTMVKHSREDMRATEIMDQKMEQIRLYSWLQVTNNTGSGCFMNPAPFPQYYDPSRTTTIPVYWCQMRVTNVPSSFPSSYTNDMCMVSIVVLWTNHNGGSSITTHARTNQTYVAHYGIHNYVY